MPAPGERGDPLRGPSVHYLRTRFLEELEDAGFSRQATIHDIEPAFIRAKSAEGCCPRDGLRGLAFVDTLEGADSAGRADVMLSYTWSYTVGEIVDALVCYCQRQGLDMRRTYVWICCLCINQHRVQAAKQQGAVVPFDEFAHEFSSRVRGIGHVLALMGTWRAPKYITRAWCTYEMYMAMVLQCKLDIILPPGESDDFFRALSEGSTHLDTLWEALEQIDVRKAEASIPSDKEQILRQIASGPGCTAVSQRVRTKLHSWFIETASEEVQRLKSCSEHCRAACQAGSRLAHLLLHLGKHKDAAQLTRDLLNSFKPSTQSSDLALGANLLNMLADALMHTGDPEGARASFKSACRMHRTAGTIKSLDGADFQRQYAGFLSNHGETSDAMRMLSEAFSTLEALGAAESYLALKVFTSRQVLHASLNQHEEAMADVKKAFRAMASSPRSPCYVYHSVLLAYSLLKAGDEKRAQEICNEAHSVLVSTGALDTVTWSRVLTIRGWVKAEMGDTAGALRDCQAAYSFIESRGLSETDVGIDSMFALARIRHDLGDSTGSQDLKQRALQACSKAGIVPLLHLATPDFYAELASPSVTVGPWPLARSFTSALAHLWTWPQWCAQSTSTLREEEVITIQSLGES